MVTGIPRHTENYNALGFERSRRFSGSHYERGKSTFPGTLFHSTMTPNITKRYNDNVFMFRRVEENEQVLIDVYFFST